MASGRGTRASAVFKVQATESLTMFQWVDEQHKLEKKLKENKIWEKKFTTTSRNSL